LYGARKHFHGRYGRSPRNGFALLASKTHLQQLSLKTGRLVLAASKSRRGGPLFSLSLARNEPSSLIRLSSNDCRASSSFRNFGPRKLADTRRPDLP
jgi:hypothetical protein